MNNFPNKSPKKHCRAEVKLFTVKIRTCLCFQEYVDMFKGCAAVLLQTTAELKRLTLQHLLIKLEPFQMNWSVAHDRLIPVVLNLLVRPALPRDAAATKQQSPTQRPGNSPKSRKTKSQNQKTKETNVRRRDLSVSRSVPRRDCQC